MVKSASMNRIVRPIVAGSVALCLAACGPALLPLNPSSTIQGRPVAGATLVVKQPFTFSPGGTTFNFPAGTYRPVFEDADGMYFRADAPVLLQDALFGSQTRAGGVYLARGASTAAPRAFIVQPAGNTTLYDTPLSIDMARSSP